MTGVEVSRLDPARRSEAVGVIARGMRDNPLHVAVFGPDPERRVRQLEAFFGAILPWMREAPMSAIRDDAIVGVSGLAWSDHCLPTPREMVRLAPTMLRLGPAVASRSLRWRRAWTVRDPQTPHWHLGPLVVDAHLQHRGIGSRLMGAFCEHVDAQGAAAYLETDKPENVVFYRRFGFETIAEGEVIGTPNWFMVREPP